MSWIAGNRYLTREEMENNALEVYSFFKGFGWSLNAISAMLGNMESESNINPGLWENLTVDYSRGYGLVQWTPATKYIDWAGSYYEMGNKQCERIQYEMINGLQWYPNTNAPIEQPPITLKEFSTSNLDVSTLANYFLWYYEQPKNINQPNRATQALSWYAFLSGEEPVIPTPSTKKKKMPLYMMCRRITF